MERCSPSEVLMGASLPHHYTSGCMCSLDPVLCCMGSMLTRFFCPRDAMLARVLAIAPCLSSQIESVETDERIELVLGVESSFHLSYTVLEGNSGISRSNGTSLWESKLRT